MYWFLIKTLMSSILGSSFYKWFENTRVGVWFQDKLDDFMDYIADKYDIHIAKKEAKWRADYPLLAERIDILEANMHPPVTEGNATDLDKRIKVLEKQLKQLRSKK